MSDLRQHFLAESIAKLNLLQKSLKADSAPNLRREAFRLIHTVKGTSQVFGLLNSAKLADELESLLANKENSANEAHKNLLLKGIGLLIASLGQENSEFPASFIEKLQTKNQKVEKKFDILLMRIPREVFNSFSESEQNAVISALRQRKNILCTEVVFETANFAGEYRNLQKVLAEKSEIIAALPGAKSDSAGKMGFRIFLASGETAASLQKILENYSAEIVSYNCAGNAANDLFEMFSQIAAHGEKLAKQPGKEINFTILASATSLSEKITKTLFDILLHLVRNAVDHAIEKTGKIEIRLFTGAQGLNLSVADDGKGVDLAKLRARAIAKNLISEDDVPDDGQMLELIFAPELSTAEHLSEISGRGVGLNAVKDSVEKMHGKISVTSRKTFGTKFEIFLPLAEKGKR